MYGCVDSGHSTMYGCVDSGHSTMYGCVCVESGHSTMYECVCGQWSFNNVWVCGQWSQSYSEAVIEGALRTERVFLGDTILRKTDKTLSKGDVVCLPGASIEHVT